MCSVENEGTEADFRGRDETVAPGCVANSAASGGTPWHLHPHSCPILQARVAALRSAEQAPNSVPTGRCGCAHSYRPRAMKSNGLPRRAQRRLLTTPQRGRRQPAYCAHPILLAGRVRPLLFLLRAMHQMTGEDAADQNYHADHDQKPETIALGANGTCASSGRIDRTQC